MSVNELIEELGGFNGDMEVLTMYDGFLYDLDRVLSLRAKNTGKPMGKWEANSDGEYVVVIE